MKKIVQYTLSVLTKKERKTFFSLIAGTLLASIADIASLALLLFVVSFYTQPSSIAANYLPAWLSDKNSINLILLFFIFFSLKNYSGYLLNRVQCRFIAGVASRISENRLLRYLEGEYSDYVNTDSAVLIRKISYQPTEFCQYILDGLQQVITQAILILLAVLAILLFNTKLFLILFIILLPPVVSVFYLIRRNLRAGRINTKATGERSLQHLQEAVAGFVESNIYDKKDFFLQRYITYQKRFNKYLSDYLIVQAMPSRIIEVFALLGLFMLIAISKWTGSADNTAIVTIGAFMAAAYKIIPGIVRILNISGQMNAYEFTIYDLADTGDTSRKKAVKLNAVKIESVCLRNIFFQYSDQPVLNNVNLCLKQGDFLGICGASGKGKTTIVNLLVGFLTPARGEIIINDEPADTITRQVCWPNISYVKQQPFLIHDTILHNIILDEKNADEARLADVVSISGLNELIGKFPEKLDKLITENGKNLSGGQRQRIAIARALYKKSDLIILDEPFNELDESSEHKLLQHFKSLSEKGKIIILITHNSQSLSFCNKIFSLDA